VCELIAIDEEPVSNADWAPTLLDALMAAPR